MTDNRVGPASGAPGWNMYVFRDGRQAVSGLALRSQLADALRAVPVSAGSQEDTGNNALIEALLRAGELECALADAQHPGEEQLACITDGLAANLVGERTAPSPVSLLAHLPAGVPQTLHISPPEGFAYYALHPRDMAILAAEAPSRAYHVAVVGVRTIGVTLSAVVAAELRKRGKHARRITVRPDGHPYDRRAVFSDEQKRFLCQYRNANADFLIADEGPGMSGSSFLSVADALVANRVSRDRITLLCSRQPDISQLRARDAQERWPQHRALHVSPNSFLPAGARIYVGAGLWREHLLPRGADWPESWLQMERLKFLAPDKRTLFKFEGFGRYGRAVHERVQQLHRSGFGPDCGTPESGFGVYPLSAGRLLRKEDLSRELLPQIARYCAMRASDLRSSDGHSSHQLEQMARFNAQQEFGAEVGRAIEIPDGALASEAPIVPDARMQPHEWLVTEDGRILKLDGAEHGDDHFFPGPTDIAWDLAGAIIEWQMNSEAQDMLLREYRRASGDHAQVRIGPYLMAYTSFRMGYCKMAAEAVRGSGEEHRLIRAYQRYREQLARLLQPRQAVVQTTGVATDDTPALGILEGGASPEPLAA
jgi:hypothetical protein